MDDLERAGQRSVAPGATRDSQNGGTRPEGSLAHYDLGTDGIAREHGVDHMDDERPGGDVGSVHRSGDQEAAPLYPALLGYLYEGVRDDGQFGTGVRDPLAERISGPRSNEARGTDFDGALPDGRGRTDDMVRDNDELFVLFRPGAENTNGTVLLLVDDRWSDSDAGLVEWFEYEYGWINGCPAIVGASPGPSFNVDGHLDAAISACEFAIQRRLRDFGPDSRVWARRDYRWDGRLDSLDTYIVNAYIAGSDPYPGYVHPSWLPDGVPPMPDGWRAGRAPGHFGPPRTREDLHVHRRRMPLSDLGRVWANNIGSYGPRHFRQPRGATALWRTDSDFAAGW